MIEENITFKEDIPQLSSRTLSYYGTHQREDKSKVLYTGGNQFLIHSKYGRLQTEKMFHVYFQITSIIDYVSSYIFNFFLYIEIKLIGS